MNNDESEKQRETKKEIDEKGNWFILSKCIHVDRVGTFYIKHAWKSELIYKCTWDKNQWSILRYIDSNWFRNGNDILLCSAHHGIKS